MSSGERLLDILDLPSQLLNSMVILLALFLVSASLLVLVGTGQPVLLFAVLGVSVLLSLLGLGLHLSLAALLWLSVAVLLLNWEDHGNDLLGAEGLYSLDSILLLVGLGRLLDHLEWTEFGVILYSLVRPVATNHPFGIKQCSHWRGQWPCFLHDMPQQMFFSFNIIERNIL